MREPKLTIKNSSIRKHPITTALGLMLLTIGMCSVMAIYVVPVFYPVKSPILENWWIYLMPFVPITFGLIAIFSPDTWIRQAGKAMDKIEQKIEKDE